MTTTIPEPRSVTLDGAVVEEVDETRLSGARLLERTVAILAVLVPRRGHAALHHRAGHHAATRGAMVLLPVWFLALRHWRGARLLTLAGVASAVAGIVLAAGADSDQALSTTSLVN